MRTVKEVLQHKDNAEIYSVAPITTVFDAIKAMSEHHIGALPVIQEGNLVGIMSERDYARKVILRDKSSKSTRVSEIMTTDVITVSKEHTVAQCIGVMHEHLIRHLVVVEEGAVIGVLTARDLFTEVMAEQEEIISQLEHYIRGEN